MNVNRGAKIMLRLRDPFNEEVFLSREAVLGTMLHELTHNVYGPHNALFYKKLDELTARAWVIKQQGLFDGFVGRGRKLGVKPKAAIPPQRLGTLSGSKSTKGKSPREMAFLAAEKRATDAQWCAGSRAEAEPKKNELVFIEIDSEGEELPEMNGLKTSKDQGVAGKPTQSALDIEVIDLT